MIVEVGSRRIVNLLGPSMVKTLQMRLDMLAMMAKNKEDPYQVNVSPYDDEGASIASASGVWVAGLASEVDRLLIDMRGSGIVFQAAEVIL
tara:strand:- start:77 stop:349 length:273 start_codon:yes stop_codon:yes gene_type:complete